jgi:type IV pilus assembly protein PilX
MSLVFLVLLTMIGISAMNFSTLEEKMAGNFKDQNLAFQAAESALKDAETDAFNNISNATAFTSSCTNGLCLPATAGAYIWDTVDWSSSSSTSRLYGTYTGSPAIGASLAEQPRYIVEDIPNPTTPPAGESATDAWKKGATGNEYYRITSRGVGSTPQSQSMVQIIFRK